MRKASKKKTEEEPDEPKEAKKQRSTTEQPDGPEADAYLCDDNQKHLDEGLAVLRSFHLTTSKLLIRWPSVSTNPLKVAAEVLLADDAKLAKHITELKLYGDIDASVAVKLLEAIPKLKRLDLSLSSFNHSGSLADVLNFAATRLAHITELHVSYIKLKGDDLNHLVEIITTHKVLRYLELSGCGIDDAMLRQISAALEKRSAPLHNLGLNSNDISDGNVVASIVARGDALELNVLSLFQNKLNHTAAKVIAEAFTSNKSIRSLTLSLNKLGAGGTNAMIGALAKRPGAEKSVDQLDLSRGGLPAAARKKLEATIKSPPIQI